MEKLRDLIYEVTNKSMAFYEKFFGHDFPYKKYDQVFCAEFKWGAMENAVKKLDKEKYFYYNKNKFIYLYF